MVSNKEQLKKEAEASVSLSEAAPEPHIETHPEPVPRPKSPFSQAMEELRDAFPDADEPVRRAVLVAASCRLERAFNGMLALSDDTIRPSPPTPVAKDNQIARDEELARQLARDYRAPSSRQSGDERRRSSDRSGSRQYSDLEHDDDSWDNFSENIRQGWTETTKKVSSLFGQLRERIQNEMADPYEDNEGDLYGVPERRSSHPRRGSPRYEDAPPPPPRPQRTVKPVNAFGEEQASRWQPLQASETSDAFFIGESDSDLESLTGDGEPGEGKSARASKTDLRETGSKSDSKGPKADSKADSKEPKTSSKTDSADSKGPKTASKDGSSDPKKSKTGAKTDSKESDSNADSDDTNKVEESESKDPKDKNSKESKDKN